MPGDRAQAGERHVVGVNEEVLIGRTVQQPAAGAHRPDGIVIPRGTPVGMAELQLIVEQVAHAEQSLVVAVQQDRGMPGGVAGGIDDADAGQDLGVIAERAQPAAEEPDRLARRPEVLVSGAARSLRTGPEGHLGGMGEPRRPGERQLPGPGRAPAVVLMQVGEHDRGQLGSGRPGGGQPVAEPADQRLDARSVAQETGPKPRCR